MLRLAILVGWCLIWLGVAWAMLDPAPVVIATISDKAIHFASFLAMSFAAIGFCRDGRQLLATGGICLIAGMILETAQMLVPSRSFEWVDMLANLSGAVLGTLLAGLLLALARQRRQRRRRPPGRPALSPRS